MHDIKEKMNFKGVSLQKNRNEFFKKETRLRILWQKRLSQQMVSLPEYENIFRAVKRAFRRAELLS